MKSLIKSVLALLLILNANPALAEPKERITGFVLRGDVDGSVNNFTSDRNGYDDPYQLVSVETSDGQIEQKPIGEYIDGLVVQVEWRHLQKEEAGPITENNVIDQAIARVNEWNNDPETTNTLGIKLRVFSGVFSPKWLTYHWHKGKYKLKNCEKGQNATAEEMCGVRAYFKNNKQGIIPSHWKLSFRTHWRDLQEKLADKYDNVPVIRELAVSGCMTHHAETMWRNKGDYNRPDGKHNVQALLNGGMTLESDKSCLRWQIKVAAKKWDNTPIAMAYNMWNDYEVVNDELIWTTKPQFTKELMDKCIEEADTNCILGNNSLGLNDIGDENNTDDVTYYLKEFGDAGHHIYVQTETTIDHQWVALNHAADVLNAQMGELPKIKAMNKESPTFLTGSNMQNARNNLKF
ncbi:hypothetical protein D515_03642 [Grimontia indica]|uniref:Uncharacterized protein n=2 Tax=Grimontia indica TaxID=1056512 RepID=R1IQK0_9GAMM|nr:hypothetical protein D515_03642 [Grimontia indica]